MNSRRRPPPIVTKDLTPKKKSQKIAPSNSCQQKVCHIMVKHRGSENKLSWRTGKQVEITRDEAFEELTGIRRYLTLDNFCEIASTRSDCHSYKTGGNLGSFGIKAWKKLEDVVESLETGQISDICETESGLHVAIRID